MLEMKGLNWPSEQYSSQTRTFKEVLFLVFQIGKKSIVKGQRIGQTHKRTQGVWGPRSP